MGRYIIRLDDACPTMNHNNWDRMQNLLDKYNVKPIVGVIPCNQDPKFDWPEDDNFWGKVKEWQLKDWEISLHGLHHLMHYHKPGREYYQLSHGVNTEFAGVDFYKQKDMLSQGYNVFTEKGISVKSFFAPAHTYDKNTVKALSEMEEIQFISDGYGLSAYNKDGVTFLPSICDGPFRLPWGTYTFVFHPSVMKEQDFLRLESFLKSNQQDVITVQQALQKVKKNQGISGLFLEYFIYLLRGLRKLVK